MDVRIKRAAVLALILISAFLMGAPVRADQLREFYRGVRAMGMGGAITAITDDADSVFYNPAGLALNDEFEVRLINPKIDVTSDDVTSITDLKGAATQLDSAVITNLFGKHIGGSASIFPSMNFPHFALGYYAAADASVVARNLSMTSIETRYVVDNGIVGGIGFETRGLSKRHYFRFGPSIKYIQRLGFDEVVPLKDILGVNKTYFEDLVKGPAFGFSFGAGLQYEIPMTKRDDLIFGSAWQDIGDTHFIGGDGASLPPIVNNLSAGGAYIHRFGTNSRSRSNIKFSAEMRHLAQSNTDPRLKMHFGMELQFPMLSFWAGVNQDSITGGVGFNFWALEVAAATYGVESQSLAYLDRERRYILQISLSFDFMSKKSRSMREENRYRRPRLYD